MARWTRADRRYALALAAAACASIAAVPAPDVTGEELRFARHGDEVARLDLDALRAIADAETPTVFEPYEARPLGFRGIPLAPVLDAVYGEGWRDEDELLFHCRDGYQPSLPVSRAIAESGWLAFAREGRDPADFSIDKRESGRVQRVDLAPFYLIWDNLDDARLRRQGDYGWPYQLVGIELIRAAERFPRMAPPEGSGEQVERGFRAFRMHCSRCHRINGEGGAIGAELNARPSPAGRADAAWLRRWIEDPSRFAATARMPALNPALPDRDATIDAIVAYLQALAKPEPAR